MVHHKDGARRMQATWGGDGAFRVCQRAAAGSQRVVAVVTAAALQAEVPRAAEKHGVVVVETLRAVRFLPGVPTEGRS